MSLINEALKKAQRQRAEEASGQTPASGAQAGPRRGLSKETIVLLSTAAAVLVVLSVVLTVILVNRAPAPKTASAPVIAQPTPLPAPIDEPSPVIVAPQIKLPDTTAPAPESGQSAARVGTESAPSPATVQPESSPSADTVAPTPAAPLFTLPSTTAPDPRIQDFVDAVRVTGIRSSGDDSRVLMNERVYRVNDIVQRELGVRLIKVEPSRLTFSDLQGNLYTKNL